MGTWTQHNTQIREILQQLDGYLDTVKDEDNRRKAPRVNIRTPMMLFLLAEKPPESVDVFSRNISLSGMGFVSRRQFHQDERVAISLRIPNMPAKLILARVTFGRPLKSGFYEMGAEFLESIRDAGGYGRIPNRWLNTAIPSVVNVAPATPAAAASAN